MIEILYKEYMIMPRTKKIKETKVDQKLFRFMCLKSGKNSSYHTDFTSSDDAIEYVNNLNDDDIEWYGVFEVDSNKNTLHRVLCKRLKPIDMSIPENVQSESIKNKNNKNNKHNDGNVTKARKTRKKKSDNDGCIV